MPRRSSEVAGALTRKGFEERRSGDHRFFTYMTAGGLRSSVRTKISHGAAHDISDGLLGQMARQCGLNKRQFLDFVDCTLEQETFETLLREQKLLR